jgi:hypothetical protein
MGLGLAISCRGLTTRYKPVRLVERMGSTGRLNTREAFLVFVPATVLCAIVAALAPALAHGLSFSGPTTLTAGSAPTAIAAGQFNADANTDLAVANDGSNNVSILLGNGTGAFTGPTNLFAGIDP